MFYVALAVVAFPVIAGYLNSLSEDSDNYAHFEAVSRAN